MFIKVSAVIKLIISVIVYGVNIAIFVDIEEIHYGSLNMALFICIVEVILIIIMSRRSKKISTDNFDNMVQ